MSVNGRIGAARARFGTGAGLLALLAGCAAADKAAPPAPPPRVHMPAPRPAPPPPAPAPPPEWRDSAVTAGGWTYSSDPGGSRATFGADPAAPVFILACELQRREISLSRPTGAAAAMVVRTSYGVRTLANPRLPASDGLFDEIVFSRGRFSIEGAGLPTLVIPAWAEPARVVEDCRG
jgi:hypothetical protein